jgi:AraC-like DNA-binding protein
MSLSIRYIEPHPLLKESIQHIFIYETSGRLPAEDLKLIVPNGFVKLVIPFANGLSGRMVECNHVSEENSITLIGVSDIPAVVDITDDGYAGNITVEFSPHGAYRFFNLALNEVKNKIFCLNDVLGKSAKTLEEQVSNVTDLIIKVNIVQQYLIDRLKERQVDLVFEYCIRKIIGSKGKIEVCQLEKETGYSSRWLNMKFQERLGVSPKNIASIVRFQQLYALMNKSDNSLFKREFYEYYYDQSHFIKDFKRFTGFPPSKLIKSRNEFDSIFYNL